MKTNEDELTRQRVIAAVQVERRLLYFAEEVGLPVSELMWNLGHGLILCRSHRLDFQIGDLHVRMYLLDEELLDYLNNPHCAKVDARLEDVVDSVVGIDLPPSADFYLSPAIPHSFQ